MNNTITTAAELDALPEGEAVVQTLGGLWIKGSGTNWHRPLRDGETKVRSSTYLEQVGNLTLIAPLSDAALIEEAARRGLSVMDAAEAARLRGRSEALDAVVSVHAEYFVMDREPFDDASPEPEDVWRYDRDFRTTLLHVDIESEAGA